MWDRLSKKKNSKSRRGKTWVVWGIEWWKSLIVVESVGCLYEMDYCWLKILYWRGGSLEIKV